MKITSRYYPKYIRSLVYMMQASEYNTADFLKWYKKVKDFREVEQRKRLVKTAKAIILLVITYATAILIIPLSIVGAIIFDRYIIILIAYIISPFILPFVLVFYTFIFGLLQKPIERKIMEQARKTLSKHQAIKIAVAGSFGKTTMKEILKTTLEQSRKVKATPDNKNTPIGISRFVEKLEGDEDILIFEMGEYYSGDIKNLCQIVNPDIGIITGVNEAHLEKFKTIESTTKTIFELADFLAKKPNTTLYVNKESKLAKEKSSLYTNVILYGQEGVESREGDWKVKGEETSLSGTSFVLKNNKNDGIVVNSKLLGLHQIGPLSAVVHIAKSLHIKTEDIEMGLKNTKSFEHRMEPKEIEGGVMIIDDSYNGNPDGVKVAINFLKEIKNKRRFYITPGLVEMGSKTQEIHKQIGHQLADSQIEKVVLIKNSTTPFIEEGLKEGYYKGEVIWFEDALTAFKTIPKMTISNDLLLFQNDWPDNYF